jgi:hypothetical protein
MNRYNKNKKRILMGEINEWIKRNKFFAFILIVVSIVTIIMIDKFEYSSEIQAYANMLMVLGIIAAFLQIRQSKKQLVADHDWNRRQFALTESIRIAHENKKIHDEHDKDLKYREKKLDDVYKMDSDNGESGIHDLICEKDEKGILKRKSDGSCMLTEEGRKISGAIKTLLNNYEYLSAGIQEDIFDEETVKRMHKTNMFKTFNVFKLYIYHLRQYTGRSELWSDLETVVLRWEDEERNSTTKREATIK